MNSFLLSLEYRGTNYFGWQIQNNSKEKTIQGELENAIRLVFKIDNFKTLGASRTDKGVHALAQFCRLDIALDIDPLNIKKALNDILPKDIHIKNVKKCSSDFHPIYSCEKKTYKYLFTDKRENIPVFLNDLIHYTPYDLDLIKMQIAAKKVIGEHDFKNFQCVGTEVATTIRTIFKSEVKNLSDSDKLFGCSLKNIWVYQVEGNGFLKQMVRLLMGGILNVGRGKISLEEFQNILNLKVDERAGKVVGPEGLYLTEVIFKANE